ncbi:MAG: polysaccharide biosynthesis C-terminal domain-containing protein [Nitrospinota bacterium]
MNAPGAVRAGRPKPGLAGETLWVVAGYVGTTVITVAAIRVLTELLPPGVYGQQSLILAGVALLISVFINPVNAGFSRFYHECKAEGTLRSLFSTTALGLLVVLSGLSLFLAALMMFLGSNLKGFPLWVLLVSILLLWTFSFTTLTITGVLNLSRRRKAAVYWKLLDTFLKYGLVSVVVLTLGAGIAQVMLGYVGASLVVTLMLLFVLLVTIREDSSAGTGLGAGERPRPEKLWDQRMWLRLAAYGYPFTFTSALGWVIALSDRYLVATLVSLEAAGIYTLGYQVGSFFLSSGAAVFNRLFVPVLFSVHEGALDHFMVVFRLFLYVFSPLFVFMLLFGPALVDLMAAKAYGTAGQIVPLVALGLFFMICGQMMDLTFQLMKRTRTLIVIWGVPAVLNIAGNLLLIPRLGILGAAISTALAYGVMFGLTTYLSIRYWRWPFPWGDLVRSLGVAAILGAGVHLAKPIWEGEWVSTAISAAGFLLVYSLLVVWARGSRLGGLGREAGVPKGLGQFRYPGWFGGAE